MQKVKVFRAFGGGCNGCDIEIDVLELPKFGIGKYGVEFTYDPKEANIMLITGIVNHRCVNHIIDAYNSLKRPCVVIAVGNCAISGNVFYDSPVCRGPAARVVPIDIYVTGCPPHPHLLARAIERARDMVLGKRTVAEEREVLIREVEDFRGTPELNTDKCIACDICRLRCPTGAISVDVFDHKISFEVFLGRCISCATCEESCLEGAIVLSKRMGVVSTRIDELVCREELEVVRCKMCGRPISSLAMREKMVSKLRDKKLAPEQVSTLLLCSECRSKVLKKVYDLLKYY